MALYESLTKESTPEQIAAAYAEVVGGAGGDTQANQEIAVNYLTNLGISAPTILQGYQTYLNPTAATTTGGGALDQASAASTQAAANPYFQANPDVAAAYANRFSDPNLANYINSTPEQFAQAHYEKYGWIEQRASPTSLAQDYSFQMPAGFNPAGGGLPAVTSFNPPELTGDYAKAAIDDAGPTLTYYTGQKFKGNQVVNLAQEIAGAASYGDLQGGVYGTSGQSIGFDLDQSKKVLGDNPNVVGQVFLDAAAQLINRGITSLSQLQTKDIMGQGIVNPETDEYGNPTGRYVVKYGGDEYTAPKSRVLTDAEVAQLVPYQYSTDEGQTGTAYQPIQTVIGKGIYDQNGKLITDTGELLIGDTYTGEGATQYYLTLDESGKPAFRTTGIQTGDSGLVAPLLFAANFIPGAQPFVAIANAALAAKANNPLAAIASLTGVPGVGDFVPTELTSALQTANQINNAVDAAKRGDLLAFANAGVNVTGTGGGTLGDTGLTVGDVLKGANFAKAVASGNQDQFLRALSSIIGSQKTGTSGGITNRTYDDTIVQAGADAFIKAKQAGASDDDAYAAANAVTTPATQKDLGEFQGLDQAIAANKAASTVAVSNAEADTLQEALALAQSKNPNATSFTYGGQQYNITPSNSVLNEAARADNLDRIKNEPTFNDAFAKARDLLGPNQTFEWNGKQYSTATFAERPDLSGNVVPGAESTTAGAGRGSYAGYNSAEEMVNKVKSTPSVTEYGGPTILGVPVGTPQDALNTVNRMGDVVLDFSRGIGSGFGNFMNQVGTLAHIASASLSGGDTKDTLIAKDNLLSTLGKDLAGYYNNMTTDQSKKEWSNIVNDVKNAPEYLKPFVAVKSTLQNFGGFVNQLGTETGEEVAPLLTGLGVGSKLLQLGASGTAKTIGITSTLGDMAESAQGSYDNVMDRLKDNKTMSDEEKHWRATQAAAGSMAATAVFGYGANSYLAKSIMGDMIATPAQKVLGPLAVEYVTEYPESFLQSLNDKYAEKGSVDANDIREANTDGAISALLGAKTSGVISGAVQVVGKVSNEFVGAESGDKTGLAIIQSPDGQIGFVPAGDLKVGQEVNADNLTQLQGAADVVSQFNFEPEQAAKISESVDELDLTRADRQEAANQEANNFNPSQIDINSALQSKADTGVETQTKDGVTTQTSTNPNNNTQTTVTTDANNNTTTETVVNSNNNITTETSVNNNTNVTTQVTTDPNTNTKTSVTTDPNNNTQTIVVVDVKTGDIISKDTTEIPADWNPPSITTVTPVEPTVQTPKTAAATPKTPTKKAAPGAAGLAGGVGAMLPSGFDMESVYLPSKETQKAIDPLQRVMEAQAELEKTAMMQQIDPRLLGLLQERMTPDQQPGQPQQFNKDIGALAQMLSGQPAQTAPAANENPYYSYGSETSIDSILGGKAANYAEGGYVEPLKASGGAMALPLLAKSGGALGQYGGRENFKDGKHVAGEGDGQSDDIPAWLADGEFVFPADVVSALGNGSTKAGTDKLYEMMHSIRDRARSKGPEDLPPPALKSPLDYLKSHKRSK